MKYDVIVIGGGLAGLSLCLDLRKRGYCVSVIEKGSYPRQKVCGEYISMESHRYLNALCPSLASYELPRIENFRISTLGNKSFNTPLGLGGFGISRYLLEDLLYQEALKQGVFFLLDTKVNAVEPSDEGIYRVITKSQTLEARLVCNASGRRSNLEMSERGGKEIGTNYIGVKYHIRLERDPKLIEIHNFPGGYCGISNIEDGKSCLCYIVNSRQLAASGKSIPEMEKRVLRRNKELDRIFSKAEFITQEPVTISGINFLIKEPLNANTFFVGDSAGSIAPVTGNGMSMALRSSYMLAKYIDDHFSGRTTKEQLEQAYKKFWNREFATRIKLSRHFQKLSEYPALTGMTIGLFKAVPPLAKSVIRLTHGKPF